MKCKICHTEDPAEFYDSISTYCRTHWREQVRQYRLNNLEKVREYDRARGQDEHRKQRNRENYRKRISTPEGRKREWEKKRKYRNGAKRAANVIVGHAIRAGKITPQPCEVCGEAKADAHHENYYKPLEITWLCKKHHGERHREINEAIRNGEDWSDRGF